MSGYTEHYNLKKPSQSENYNVEDANTNNTIIDAILFGKIDKAVGKDLSSNDFTNEYKLKLDAMGKIYNYLGIVQNLDALGRVENSKKGDLYHVQSESADYAWNGTEWQKVDSNKGDTGVGITEITCQESIEDSGINVITIKLSDGRETSFNVRNGTKGKEGEKGEKGDTGQRGETGSYPVLISTVTGNIVHIENSSDLSMKLKLNGGHEQKTTKGKQLLDPAGLIASTTKNGVTLTNNGDGTFNISGTATANANFILYNIKDIYEANHYFGLYSSVKYDASSWNLSMQITYTDGSDKKYISPINPAKFTNENVNNATIVLYFPSGTTINQTNVKIMLYKDDSVQATEYEPYTGGQASPSPDYPQAVETVKNSVEIIKRNKNQFDIEEQTRTNNGITTTYKEGKFSLTGTATTNWASITNANTPFNLKTGKYTISVCNFTPTENYSLEFTLKHSDNNYTKWYLDKYNTHRTYILDKDVISITMGLSKFKAGDTLNLEFPIQLVSGDTLDDFINPQSETYTLPVQQEMLEGDYIDDVEHHGWAKQILDGSEDWNLNTQYENTFYNTLSNTVFPGITEDKDCFTLISDKLIWGGIVTSSSGFKDGYMYGFLRGDSGKMFKRINFKSTKFSTIDELKTYLASNPITVYYKLATPIDLPLTDEQKTIMNGIHTYKNVTNLLADNDLATMDVEYQTDAEVNELLNEQKEKMWGVGSIYTTTSEKNPSEILGFGKWEKKNIFHGGELIAYGEMHNGATQGASVAKDVVFQFSSNKIPNKIANIKNYVEGILISDSGTIKVAPKGIAGLVKATLTMAGLGGLGCTGLWYSDNNNPLPTGVTLISKGTLIGGINGTYGGNSCNYMYEVTDEADVDVEFYVNPKAQPYGGAFTPTRRWACLQA